MKKSALFLVLVFVLSLSNAFAGGTPKKITQVSKALLVGSLLLAGGAAPVVADDCYCHSDDCSSYRYSLNNCRDDESICNNDKGILKQKVAELCSHMRYVYDQIPSVNATSNEYQLRNMLASRLSSRTCDPQADLSAAPPVLSKSALATTALIAAGALLVANGLF